MAEKSRVRFNPGTKEIEVEGSESFVKVTLGRLLAMLSGAPEAIVKEPKPKKVRLAKKAEKKPKVVKERPTKKAAKKEPGKKRVTNIDTVVGLIQGSAEGISTAELKEKTGFAENQIWGIVTRAAKEGKIRKVKRGVYVGAA